MNLPHIAKFPENDDYQFSTDEFNKFKAHLEPKYNHRIIFSSKYGKGKTTFLNNFFKEQKDKYIVLHLFPVNYSVAENKDIFELIKYDIICELTRQGLISLETEKGKEEEIFLKAYKEFPQAIKTIMHGISLANPALGTIISVIVALIELGEKTIPERLKSNEKILESFQDGFLGSVGFLYEHNLISKLIEQEISKTKEKLEKEVILILDDLDRLDPDHIFRILNIFSAHCDESRFQKECESKTNKFDFDKVIFVCDAQNIRSIFEHRFGPKADFEGYFDKFFSIEQYNFDSKQEIKNRLNKDLEKQIESLKNDAKDVDIGEVYSIISHHAEHQEKIELRLFSQFIIPMSNFILDILIDTSKVNFRNIRQVKTFNFKDTQTTPIETIFDFLIRVIGSPDFLYKIFSDTQFQNDFNIKFNDLLNKQSYAEMHRYADQKDSKFHNTILYRFKIFISLLVIFTNYKKPNLGNIGYMLTPILEKIKIQTANCDRPEMSSADEQYIEKTFNINNENKEFHYAQLDYGFFDQLHSNWDNRLFIAKLIKNAIENIYMKKLED